MRAFVTLCKTEIKLICSACKAKHNITQRKGRKRASPWDHMPEVKRVAAELARVGSMDDFLGMDGIFAKLFGNTLEQMVEDELTDYQGHTKPKMPSGGNSRNGNCSKEVQSSEGKTANHSFTNVVFPKSTGA